MSDAPLDDRSPADEWSDVDQQLRAFGLTLSDRVAEPMVPTEPTVELSISAVRPRHRWLALAGVAACGALTVGALATAEYWRDGPTGHLVEESAESSTGTTPRVAGAAPATASAPRRSGDANEVVANTPSDPLTLIADGFTLDRREIAPQAFAGSPCPALTSAEVTPWPGAVESFSKETTTVTITVVEMTAARREGFIATVGGAEWCPDGITAPDDGSAGISTDVNTAPLGFGIGWSMVGGGSPSSAAAVAGFDGFAVAIEVVGTDDADLIATELAARAVTAITRTPGSIVAIDLVTDGAEIAQRTAEFRAAVAGP